MSRSVDSLNSGRLARRSVVITASMLGIGVMGAIDEIVFHQLLQWHNFYVDTDDFWRVFSDGIFHIFTATLLFLGALRLWADRREISGAPGNREFAAGILLGAGGCQVFDGIVNHKILQLHPVREDVDNIILYDIGWVLSGAVVMLAGWLVWRTVQPSEAGQSSPGPWVTWALLCQALTKFLA